MPTRVRRTIAVEVIRQRVNGLLARTDTAVTDEYRRGAASVLELVLHATGNYRGFGYHGVTYPEGGDPVIPNETRRRYY